MKNYLFCFLIIILTSCGIDKESAPPLSSSNNSGELDISFYNNGYLALNGSAGGNLDDEIFAMARDSQDRIIAVGSSHNGSDSDMAVWRLTSSGALDNSFSGNGIFTHDSAAGGGSTDVAYGVAVDANDDIYITGTSFNGADFDMVIWKLSSSGTLDTSFNGSGIFTDDNAAGGANHDQGTAIHINNSGQILVTGFSDQTLTNRDLAVWKLSANGALDVTFDADGIFTHDSAGGGEDDQGNDIKTDSSGNVFVVGRSDSAGNIGDMAVWKLTPFGALDTTFNGTGFLTHDNAAGGASGVGLDSATALALDNNGDLLITGYSRNANGNNDMVLWKVDPNGFLDTTFDADGFLTFDVSDIVGGGTNDTGESILIDSEGRIVIVGSGNENLCIWRFNDDGTLDENFNTDGFFSHDSAAGGFSIDSGTSVVEGANNSLYIGGFSENDSGDFDATFWRLK